VSDIVGQLARLGKGARWLFEGAPDAVLHDPDVRRLYLGEDFER